MAKSMIIGLIFLLFLKKISYKLVGCVVCIFLLIILHTVTC